MTKVITYGTFDMLHHGHVRLLERAKALGDHLIVAVTSDDFDKTRGKINVVQPLMERIESVRNTGLADEIIVEEYEGQKIDDIIKYDIDIFTVGSDWVGKFDYLSKYCQVTYLDRTEGISSTELRNRANLSLGIIGDSPIIIKMIKECGYVNGINVVGIHTNNPRIMEYADNNGFETIPTYDGLLEMSDAIYIISAPDTHYDMIEKAISKNVHVLCESPISVSVKEFRELRDKASASNVILLDAIKTLYATAFRRMVRLIETGAIGDVVSVDATCTSLSAIPEKGWGSMTFWGPTAMAPIVRILGPDWKDVSIVTKLDEGTGRDLFTKADILYDDAVASFKVGCGAKSEGDLVITGTKGYIYVPAPWWKTDYFEVRFEDPSNNRRYFYQLDGEGLRYMLVAFVKMIEHTQILEDDVSRPIVSIMEMFNDKRYRKIR